MYPDDRQCLIARSAVLKKKHRANLKVGQAEIAAHSSANSGRKKWKTRDGVHQLKDAEKSEQAMSATDDAIYADMLRDV